MSLQGNRPPSGKSSAKEENSGHRRNYVSQGDESEANGRIKNRITARTEENMTVEDGEKTVKCWGIAQNSGKRRGER